MIGKLKGKLAEIDGNTGLIETSSGVFYRVFLTPFLISHSVLNTPIEVYTFLQVREDALTLFAFKTKAEYSCFELLLTVSGVGPKTAYLVISSIKVNDLIRAVKENNIDFFVNIKGLGKKTAMKIILELSQKLEQRFDLEKMYLSDEDKTVIDALVSLGFKNYEAKKALSNLPKNLSVENKIKEALKLIK